MTKADLATALILCTCASFGRQDVTWDADGRLAEDGSPIDMDPDHVDAAHAALTAEGGTLLDAVTAYLGVAGLSVADLQTWVDLIEVVTAGDVPGAFFAGFDDDGAGHVLWEVGLGGAPKPIVISGWPQGAIDRAKAVLDAYYSTASTLDGRWQTRALTPTRIGPVAVGVQPFSLPLVTA